MDCSYHQEVRNFGAGFRLAELRRGAVWLLCKPIVHWALCELGLAVSLPFA